MNNEYVRRWQKNNPDKFAAIKWKYYHIGNGRAVQSETQRKLYRKWRLARLMYSQLVKEAGL